MSGWRWWRSSFFPALVCCAVLAGRGAETVFSGPQPGEPTTSFRVLDVGGRETERERERDPIADNAGAPTAIVFVHGLERSLVPLLRVVDRYGVLRKDRLKTEIVFLAADRLAGTERVKAAQRSLQLGSRVGVSLEGAEGPGNYGLNKDCLMTILAAKGNRVSTNFALVQPGIADAARVIAALAAVCGDAEPPSIESLSPAPGAGRGDAMTRNAGTNAVPGGTAAKEPFPGAVPTDPTLNRLLRQFIRATNDVATVDRLVRDVEAHIAGNTNLTRQAVDGWTRVLHFGDRYGNEYSRAAGRKLLERWSSPPPATP